MITLNWVPLPGADVLSYRVYRSMIGFQVTLQLPASLAGQTLQLAFNGGLVQTVIFHGVLDIVSEINAQITGGRAFPAADPLAPYCFVRSDVRTAPGSVLIVGGTAVVALNTPPRYITEKSEDMLLVTIPALVDPTATVTLTDADGVHDDFYAISTVNHLGDESLKSAYRQPVTSTGALCVLEGIVSDLSGRRVPDAEVTAALIGTPQSILTGSHVSTKPLSTLSGSDGRYSLPVLQGMIVRIEIACIGYSRTITVPLTQFAFVSDLGGDDSAQLLMDENVGRL